eukprot:scaffold125730_cov37-Prasinocladus_malaysianus.AAC.1
MYERYSRPAVRLRLARKPSLPPAPRRRVIAFDVVGRSADWVDPPTHTCPARPREMAQAESAPVPPRYVKYLGDVRAIFKTQSYYLLTKTAVAFDPLVFK